MTSKLARLTRLAELVQAQSAREFRWGVFDCARFAGAAVAVQLGVDPWLRFAGDYSDETGARAVIAAAGAEGLPELVDRVAAELGVERVPVAATGDVVASRLPEGGWAVGVAFADKAYFPGPRGVRYVPVSEVDVAWGVSRAVVDD